MGVMILSWNAARLIALILNALYGLEQYYDSHKTELNVDGLLGLKIIEGQLDILCEKVLSLNIDSEISSAMRNLSDTAGLIANEAVPFVQKADPKLFMKLRQILMKPYKMNLPHQLTNEQYRWKEKKLQYKKSRESAEKMMFTEEDSDACLEELLQANEKKETDKWCEISELCLKRMLGIIGFSKFHLTHQLLFVAVAMQTNCIDSLSHYLMNSNNQTIDSWIVEFCTNMMDELAVFKRNPRTLARLDHYDRDLFMEQVFICGQFGFVEISSLHFLATILSWQDPSIGCFSGADQIQTEHINQPKYSHIRRTLTDVLHSDMCSSHSAAVASGALTVFLRFALDVGPWPEFWLTGQPVVVHSIAAEDRFHQFQYGRWVQDSLIPSSVRYPRPPDLGWSPDLLAYLMVLFLIIGGSMLMQCCYKPHTKSTYYFSYKKL